MKCAMVPIKPVVLKNGRNRDRSNCAAKQMSDTQVGHIDISHLLFHFLYKSTIAGNKAETPSPVKADMGRQGRPSISCKIVVTCSYWQYM